MDSAPPAHVYTRPTLHRGHRRLTVWLLVLVGLLALAGDSRLSAQAVPAFAVRFQGHIQRVDLSQNPLPVDGARVDVVAVRWPYDTTVCASTVAAGDGAYTITVPISGDCVAPSRGYRVNEGFTGCLYLLYALFVDGEYAAADCLPVALDQPATLGQTHGGDATVQSVPWSAARMGTGYDQIPIARYYGQVQLYRGGRDDNQRIPVPAGTRILAFRNSDTAPFPVALQNTPSSSWSSLAYNPLCGSATVLDDQGDYGIDITPSRACTPEADLSNLSESFGFILDGTVVTTEGQSDQGNDTGMGLGVYCIGFDIDQPGTWDQNFNRPLVGSVDDFADPQSTPLRDRIQDVGPAPTPQPEGPEPLAPPPLAPAGPIVPAPVLVCGTLVSNSGDLLQALLNCWRPGAAPSGSSGAPPCPPGSGGGLCAGGGGGGSPSPTPTPAPRYMPPTDPKFGGCVSFADFAKILAYILQRDKDASGSDAKAAQARQGYGNWRVNRAEAQKIIDAFVGSGAKPTSSGKGLKSDFDANGKRNIARGPMLKARDGKEQVNLQIETMTPSGIITTTNAHFDIDNGC